MTTPRSRLKRAMLSAGFNTPTEAWTKHKKLFSLSTITSALNGHRNISRQMAAKFGQAFSVDPGWILYGGDGTPRSAPNSSDFGEVLLRTAALSDQEALKLYLALGERFGASVHSGSPGDVPAGNEATAPRHPRKRS